MNRFAKDDIVHLNSGSPDLLVESVEGDEITVSWNDDDGQRQTLTSDQACFTKAG